MTAADKHQAAIRKAARELTKPLEVKLANAERTISALTDKLARAEIRVVEARRELLRQKLSL